MSDGLDEPNDFVNKDVFDDTPLPFVDSDEPPANAHPTTATATTVQQQPARQQPWDTTTQFQQQEKQQGPMTNEMPQNQAPYSTYGGEGGVQYLPPRQGPAHMQPLQAQAYPAAMHHGMTAGHHVPPMTTTLASSSNNNNAASILLGGQIQAYYPQGKNFILGCGQFHPLDNEQVREFIRQYFITKLDHDADFRQAQHLGVTAEMDALLARARVELGGIRFWDKVNKHDKLTKKSWLVIKFQDISTDLERVKKRFNETLRNILANLRTGGTNSRIRRKDSKGPKRHRDAGDYYDQYAQPDILTSFTMPAVTVSEPDEATLINYGLAEIHEAVEADIRKLEECNDWSLFKRQVEFGVVAQRLTRLTSARMNAGPNFTKWAQAWAKRLIPKEERSEASFDVQDYLQANRLDADRKVCVEYLKILHRKIEKEVFESSADGFKEHHLVGILSCTLEMDRAKARFFNFLMLSSRRGQHWYAKNHVNSESEWFQEEWKLYVENYEGRPTISRHLMWYFDQASFGLHKQRYAKLRELLEPKKAWWADAEQVQVE